MIGNFHVTYSSSSIRASPTQPLVNIVNVVGAMEKGLALVLSIKLEYAEA